MPKGLQLRVLIAMDLEQVAMWSKVREIFSLSYNRLKFLLVYPSRYYVQDP